MTEQSANDGRPEWATGLSDEHIAVVRREAIRRGITPGELVRLWVLELVAKLLGQKAA